MPRVAARSALATVLAISGVAGLGVIFWPDMRAWFATNPWWAWGVALVLSMLVAALIAVGDRTRQNLIEERSVSEELRRSNSAALVAHGELQRELAGAEAKISDLQKQRDELGASCVAARETVSDLEQRLAEPSARDRIQFNSILDDLPWEFGILPWLDNTPLKQWTDVQSDPIYSLEAKWAEWFFDSSVVEECFVLLREALSDFTHWMGTRGFSLNSEEVRDFGWKVGDPVVYRLVDGDERVDGWEGHYAERHEGNRLAAAFLDRRRTFERVGRAARL